MWKRRREMLQHLSDASYWLGSDASQRVAAGDSEEILKKLLRWQKVIGKPGSPIPKIVENALSPAPARMLEEIAATRDRVADTIAVVARIHGVTAPMTLSRHWGDLTYPEMQRALDFSRFAERTGKGRECSVDYSGEEPTRLLGNYGFSGYLTIRITGTQFALEEFMHTAHLVHPSVAKDLERHCTPWRNRHPLPPYQTALTALGNSLIPVERNLLGPDKLTHQELIEKVEAHIAALREIQASFPLDTKRQVPRISPLGE